MLYLIGGAARAGKTILAQRLLQESRIPRFCVDYFVSVMEQGSPETGVESETPNLRRAPVIWPRLAPMLWNIVEAEPEYTVEGDVLWPAGVAALMERYPGLVRPVFIGYADTTPEHKLAMIRQHPGGVNDWVQKHTDEFILDLCHDAIPWSRFLRAECQKYGLPYLDVSERFVDVLEEAWRLLLCGA